MFLHSIRTLDSRFHPHGFSDRIRESERKYLLRDFLKAGCRNTSTSSSLLLQGAAVCLWKGQGLPLQ